MEEYISIYIARRAEKRRRKEQRLKRIREKTWHMRQLRDASNPFEMPAATFVGKYRLTQDMTKALVEELKPYMREPQRVTGVPVHLKVLAALHFFGHGSYQKGIAADVTAPLCQASVSNAVEEVCKAINTPQVLARHIKFPITVPEIRALIRKNYTNTSMPGVVGYVDGFHIYLICPHVHEKQYVNRNGSHSLNAQIVSDCSMVILNMLAKHPGASHDSFVWENSTVRQLMEYTYRNREECWLLGDSGYPHEPWLQVPILDAAEGSSDANFNKAHMIGRSVVERTIGHLRARFRCLSKHRVLEYHPLKAEKIANACAVLHNICVRANLPNDEEVVGEEMDGSDNEDDIDGGNNHQPHSSLCEEANSVRQGIVARVPQVSPRQ